MTVQPTDDDDDVVHYVTDDSGNLHVESEFSGMAAMCEVAEARVAALEDLYASSVREAERLAARVKALEDALLEVDRVIDDAAIADVDIPVDIRDLAYKVRLMISTALRMAGRLPASLASRESGESPIRDETDRMKDWPGYRPSALDGKAPMEGE